MTKEITKTRILQELEDKFALREHEKDFFLFSETVVPTYDIGQHLKQHVNTFAELSITSATSFIFFVVPMDERWTLYRYDVVFMGAGAHTVAGVYTQRTLDSASFCYLDLTAAQSASYHVNLPFPILLSPGSRIKINVDGYTSTQNLRLYLDYMVENIR